MRRALAALGLLAAACGPRTIGDLPRPALVVTVTEPGGFCAATYVVDAEDRVWLESGCGRSSGLIVQDRGVSAGERSELDALMDRVLALPDDPSCQVPSPSARRYRFVRTAPGSDDWPEKRVCEPGVDGDARALAERMQALVTGGADAG